MSGLILVYGEGKRRRIFDASSNAALTSCLRYLFTENLKAGVYDPIMRNPNHEDQVSRSLIPQAMSGNLQSIRALMNWRRTQCVGPERPPAPLSDPEYFELVDVEHAPAIDIPKRTFS